MGQKVNPIGLRLGKYRQWKNNWFVDSLNYSDFLHLNYQINKYFSGILRNNATKTFLSHCVISKYSFEKIYIFIFYYRLRKSRKKSNFTTKLKKIKKNYNKYNTKTLLINKQYKLIKILNLFKQTHLTYTLNTFNKNKLKNTKQIIYNKKIIPENYEIKRGFYREFKRIKNSLEEFTNTKVELIFINLLSLIRFYLISNNNTRFLINLENQMSNFYRYDVKLLRDAVNLTYICLVLKQPQTLANFIAYQLRRTPKNRRQSKLIQFYKKIINLMVLNLDEIEGIRLKFKGRINGRRRSTVNNINIGRLPLQQHDCYIEYGQSDGLTVYGSIGIKVWIFYKKSYNNDIQKLLLKYFLHSHLKTKKNYVKTKTNKTS